MTVHVEAGTVTVPTANATGSVLCHSDAQETVTLPAAPASGLNRWDLIICRPRGTDLDGGANNDFIFDYVSGAAAAAGSEAIPATPAGTVALAQVLVTGGSAAVVPANIHDVRPGALSIASSVPANMPWSYPRGWVAERKAFPASDISGPGMVYVTPTLDVPMIAKRRYRITMTGRGNTSAAGACSIRMSGASNWAPYQMVVERTNAAGEALGGTGVTIYDCQTAGTYSFQLMFVGGGTVKAVAGSCASIAEDIGGY